MSKIKLFLCAIVIACALVSCNKKSDTFMLWGVTECYSDFLFCDYEPVKMTRTLCFEVNDEMAGKNWKTKFGLFKKNDNGSYVPVRKEVLLYKNGELCPTDVTAGSSKKVWWLCNEGHEWIASVNDRNRGTRCPTCKNEKR